MMAYHQAGGSNIEGIIARAYGRAPSLPVAQQKQKEFDHLRLQSGGRESR